MQKSSLLLVTWIVYTAVLSLIWFLRVGVAMTLLLAVIGSLIGFVLPILLDILLPKVMDGSAEANRSFATSVLKESAQQLQAGNLHAASAPRTPLRSYPLLLAYLGATVYVITSTQSWFGKGFVLGLGLSLVADLFFYRKNASLLRERWFSVFRTNLTDSELSLFVRISTVVFGILTVVAALA